MEINWFGQSFFKINLRDGKKIVKIVVDPFIRKDNLKPPRTEADILLSSDPSISFSLVKSVKGKPFLIQKPGEYDVKNTAIKGIHSYKGKKMNVIYKFGDGEITICHLGSFDQKELRENQLERMGKIDILMIPVGGENLEAKTAANIVSQIEPGIIIPMNYKVPGLKAKLDKVDNFLKVMGSEEIKPQEKVKIKLKDIPEENQESKIIILKP